jgi:hypothetical protein
MVRSLDTPWQAPRCSFRRGFAQFGAIGVVKDSSGGVLRARLKPRPVAIEKTRTAVSDSAGQQLE